ncbi:uncharacterized protein LOC124120292 [Haliotis rufescens]|uniref:uncharacterized protein LOC124120292 n=1 Tax=Haliotis rufescens TaxID=6454 RepID=UPI001EB048E6|nr:uncharacterized protein LOC124120292 [Haliotis rufescens]
MLATFRQICEEQLLHDLAVISAAYSSMCQNTVTVSFETDYVLGNSARVAMVGSLPVLGSWNPKECVMATVHPGSNHWRLTVTLPRKTTFTWKWIVVSPDKSKVWRWEEQEDRESRSGIFNGRWTAPWNGIAVFTPEKNSEEFESALEGEMPLHIIRPPHSVNESLKRSFCIIL